MPNYQNSKIYVLKRTKDDKTFYVGSTVNPLSKRMGQHKDALTSVASKHYEVYQYMNKKCKNYAFYIELYKRYPCRSKEELNKFEGRVIRRLKGKGIKLQNKQVAGRTQGEYAKEYEKTEKCKIARKKHRQTNNAKQYDKEYSKKRSSIVETCECGRKYTKPNKWQHKKSLIHQRLMALKENDE